MWKCLGECYELCTWILDIHSCPEARQLFLTGLCQLVQPFMQVSQYCVSKIQAALYGGIFYYLQASLEVFDIDYNKFCFCLGVMPVYTPVLSIAVRRSAVTVTTWGLRRSLRANFSTALWNWRLIHCCWLNLAINNLQNLGFRHICLDLSLLVKGLDTWSYSEDEATVATRQSFWLIFDNFDGFRFVVPHLN